MGRVRMLLQSRWATVPDLVGQRVDDAFLTAREAGLDLVAETVEGRPPPISTVADWRVVAQRPGARVQVRRHGQVTVVVERGGGGSAGVREPRRPLPVQRTDAGETSPPPHG